MARHEYEPGKWPTVLEDGGYARLLTLARRRLVGCEHHAEDVVQRALIRWQATSADKGDVAHLEQVIKWEANSVLRTEERARKREERVAQDRSNDVLGSPSKTDQLDLVLVRLAIAESCKKRGIELSNLDIEVLELLFSGYSMTDVVKMTGTTRHTVRRSRRRWQDVIRLVLDDLTGPASQ